MPHSTIHTHTPESSPVLVLPDFISYCGYSLRENANGSSVASASEKWLLSGAHLSDKKRNAFLRLKAGDLASMCYPDASIKGLRVVADYMNYLFKLDDWTDEFEAHDIDGMRDCVMAALRNPLHYQTDKAVGKLAKSFFGRFVSNGGPNCRQRFIDTMVLFFAAVRQQALDREHEDIPDLESYIALRRDTSGCKPCFALIEYAGGFDLPNAVMDHPSIQTLEDATNDLVTWSNDIFSFNVEQSRGDTHNMVVVLMQQEDMEMQEAIDTVAEYCKNSIDTFEQVRNSMPSWGPVIDRNVQAYIEGLQNWIIGSLHWSFHTERYFGSQRKEVKEKLVVPLLPKRH